MLLVSIFSEKWALLGRLSREHFPEKVRKRGCFCKTNDYIGLSIPEIFKTRRHLISVSFPEKGGGGVQPIGEQLLGTTGLRGGGGAKPSWYNV